MALKKSQKKEVLEKVGDIAKAKSVVFVNFHGLKVADATDMRKTLRGAGLGYSVAKKTLARKAFAGTGIKGTMPDLPGELAIAYLPGEGDIVAPAREVRAFEKKFDGKVAILGGVFEDSYKSKEEMTAIAAIPGRETLLGMFVNLLNSPIQRFAVVMNEIAKTKTA